MLTTACARKRRSFVSEEHLQPDLEDNLDLDKDVSASRVDPLLESGVEEERGTETDRQARWGWCWSFTSTETHKSYFRPGLRCIGGPRPWPTLAPPTRRPARWPPSTAPLPCSHTTSAAEKNRYAFNFTP